jgi:ABC-type transporter Mla subunit MlaD
MKLAVGVFVLTLFIAIGTFLYLLLEEKGTFDERYNFNFDTESASSFNVGMPLKYSGFNIGTIDKISLKDDGSVHMVFSVSQDNRKWITKDSVLMLKKPLIGSPHIELYSAIGNEELAPNSTLVILLSDDINDMVSKLEPVVDRIISIINNLDKITSYLSSDNSDIIATLQNIKKFSNNLTKSDSLLTTITGDHNSTQSVIDSLNKTKLIMEQLQNISQDINKISSSLDKKIVQPASTTIEDVDKIMKDVKQKLDSIDATIKAVGSYDKDLYKLKEEISVGIQKSNKIIDKVDAMMQDEKRSEITLP